MKFKYLLQASILSVSLFALFGCGSESTDNTSASSEIYSEPSSLSGVVLQGPVANALVFADKNNNFQFDTDEVSIISNSEGLYNDLVIPANYGDYQLVSISGDNIFTGQIALPMVALKEYKNITPVSTLVAFSNNRDQFISELNTLSGVEIFDINHSFNSSENYVSLIKAIESVMYALKEIGVNSNKDIFIVYRCISEELSNTNAIADFNSGELDTFSNVIANGVMLAIAQIKTNGDSLLEVSDENELLNILKAVVIEAEDSVKSVSSEGVVDEEDVVLSDIDSIITANGLKSIREITNGVSIEINDVFLDDADGVNISLSNELTHVGLTFSTRVPRSYSDYSTFGEVLISIKDVNSNRKLDINFDMVEMTLTSDETGEDVVEFDVTWATFFMSAVRYNGDFAYTYPVTVPYDLFSGNITLNSITVNLEALQGQFNQVGLEDYAALASEGEYLVTTSFVGFPIPTTSRTVILD